MQAFAQGMNDAVTNRSVLPLEFYLTGLKWEEWKVEHLYLFFKIMDWGTSFSIVEEMVRTSLLSGNLTTE